MDPLVIAAWVAAGASLVTLVGTTISDHFNRRATRQDNEKTLDQQHKQSNETLNQQREQLDRTLAEQRRELDNTLTAQSEQLARTLRAQSEQLDRTLAEQRTRTLNERFATAADKLGSDKPPAVRLAGVYAMAGLADDWLENRQTCVDVLCAYLRLPYERDPGDDAPAKERLDFHASREVRHTVIRVITAHLQPNAKPSWQGLNFDFTGVVFDGGHFNRAVFSGGTVRFDGAEFSGGEVGFVRARFSGGEVYFHRAKFSGAAVGFTRAVFSGGAVQFYRTEFSGGLVTFGDARFSGGRVTFSHSEFSGGEVDFSRSEFSVSVYFGSTVYSGGTIDFTGARFSGGVMDFTGARFSGGRVTFSHSEFSGSEVDFGDALDWSHPPEFPWTGTPPSSVTLPKKKDQSQA